MLENKTKNRKDENVPQVLSEPEFWFQVLSFTSKPESTNPKSRATSLKFRNLYQDHQQHMRPDEVLWTSDLFQSRTSWKVLDNNHIWFYELQIIQSPGVNTHGSSIRPWGPAGCSLLNGCDGLITALWIRSCREVWTDEREDVRLSNLQFRDVLEEFLPQKWEVVSSHDGLIWWKCSQLDSVK